MQTAVDSALSKQNPFPGLRPFREEESHLYFGRSRQIEEVVSKIKENHFVAIVGISGIGKSSFVNCGILPRLRSGFPEPDSRWTVLKSRPGDSPVKNVVRSVCKAAYPKDFSENEIETYYQRLLEAPGELGQIVAEIFPQDPNQHFLLYIDQFEELYRFEDINVENQDESEVFIRMLVNAARQSHNALHIAITMRDDFVGKCSQFPELTRLINSSQFLIPYMTKDEIREAITGPVDAFDGQISDDLVDAILNDAGNKPDRLPVMQHALMRTWDFWQKQYQIKPLDNQSMDLYHYEMIGTMSQALSIHAGEAYKELNPDNQTLCERVFRAITEITEEGKKIRRPTSLENLAYIVGRDNREVAFVINKFRTQDRGFLMPPPEVEMNEQSTIDIAHESLIRIWDKLQIWVQDEEDSVKTYRRIAEDAEKHQLGRASLLKETNLGVALEWMKLQQPTKAWGIRYHEDYDRTIEYIKFSKEEEERERRNEEERRIRRRKQSRMVTIAISIIALFAGIFGYYAILQSYYAEQQKKEAEMQKKEAETQKELAELQADSAKTARFIAEASAKEALVANAKAQREALNAKMEKNRAEQNAIKARIKEKEALDANIIAQQEADEAELQKLIAQEKQIEAELSKLEAIEANNNALRISVLTKSRLMAKKSREIEDPNLQALVAQEAFNIHIEYQGSYEDPDVYSGLYYAVRELKGNEFNHLVGHNSNIRALIQANNNRVFSGGSDGYVHTWSVDMGSAIAPIDSWHPEVTQNKQQQQLIHRSLALNPSQNLLAVAGYYAPILIFDANNLKKGPLGYLDTKASQVRYMSFVEDNKLLSVDDQGILRVWDFQGTEAKSYKNLEPSNSSFAIVGNEELLNRVAVWKNCLVFAQNNEVKILNYNQASSVAGARSVFSDVDEVRALAFSEDGKLAIGNVKGEVNVFKINPSSLTAQALGVTLRGHRSRIQSLAFSPNGNLLATGSYDKTVRIWDVSTKKSYDSPPIVLDDHKDFIWSVVFTSDGQHVLAGTRDKQFRVWPVNFKEFGNMICSELVKNGMRTEMNTKEWARFVGIEALKRQSSCRQVISANTP